MARTDDAIDMIKKMIMSGQLGAGDRLPREADLADELRISRNSLREAVRALSMVGVLDVRQGDGTYVGSLRPDVLLGTFGFLVDFHLEEDVLHLFELRRLLEPSAAELAALRMSPEAADGLLALLDEVPPQPDLEVLVANDIEFHHRIAEASGNPFLCSIVDGLAGQTQRARLWRGLTEENSVSRTIKEHRTIALAIKDRQQDVARSWMTVHIAGVEGWLRDSVTPSRDPTGAPSSSSAARQ
jgi:GntR family transcriptional repressor for pyruvate dehydrogenase complex